MCAGNIKVPFYLHANSHWQLCSRLFSTLIDLKKYISPTRYLQRPALKSARDGTVNGADEKEVRYVCESSGSAVRDRYLLNSQSKHSA